MLSITSRRETWSTFSDSLPLSILDMSSTSLISPSRCLLDRAIFFRQLWTCWMSSMLAVAIAVMPTMAFIGVRISWLMLERNSLLALLAWTASRLAWSSSIICCLVIWKYLAKISTSAASTSAQAPKTITIQREVKPLTIWSRAL